jgi:AhpC/TSA family
MLEQDAATSLALPRRAVLLGGLSMLFAGRVQAEQAAYPPVFGTARSQFTIVRPRRKLPPLRLQGLDGRDVMLAPKPGHIALVNLWATWCAACRTDLPTLANLDRRRLPGLEVWAICTDTLDLKRIKAFLHDYGVPPQMCLADPYASAVNPHAPAASLEMVHMPITYLIGKTGMIEGYITGAADWLSPEGTALLDFYRDQADE